MIIYNFCEKGCKISFTDFLAITTKTTKLYKSDFSEFYKLYEFIEQNLNEITHILFDGYEYFIENGKLHNLYGPALVKHSEDKTAYYQGANRYFYIDGKLVYDNLNIDRGCKKIEDFQTKEIFHYEKLINENQYDPITGKPFRIREGVDYKKHYINLNSRIKKDQRNKKLKMINARIL